MIEQLKQYISTHKLCKSNAKVLVAISGGVDSVVLADLMFHLGYDIGLAHCNFGLRSEASDKDAQFVKQLAKLYGIPAHIENCDAAAYASLHKYSIQEAARELRYQWFDNLTQQHAYDVVAIAHHADDQTETFFINLFRGSGIAGLKGMPRKRDQYIRPLLFAKRLDIENYAKDKGLKWREDSSNASDKYLRNRIRHHLIPILQDVISEDKNNLSETLGHLLEDHILFQQLLDEKREGLLNEIPEGFSIQIHTLLELNPLGVWLYYLLKPFGFQRTTTNSLATVLLGSNRGQEFDAEHWQLLLDREQILLIRKTNAVDNSIYKVTAHQKRLTHPISLDIQQLSKEVDWPLGESPLVAWFDYQQLRFPLSIRKWKKGDRFTPLGMQGSKLISDFFIDNKFNRLQKESVWLLFSGETIIWIIGHRTSESCKIRPTTTTVLRVACDMGADKI